MQENAGQTRYLTIRSPQALSTLSSRPAQVGGCTPRAGGAGAADLREHTKVVEHSDRACSSQNMTLTRCAEHSPSG